MNDDIDGPERSEGLLEKSDPQERGFVPEQLDRTVIAIPLLRKLEEEDFRRSRDPTVARTLYDVIIDVNFGYRSGRPEALERAQELTRAAIDGDVAS